MEEFTKRLTAIRSGAGKAAKKAGKAVGKGVDMMLEKQKGVADARKERDDRMIRENFGSEENYRKTLGLDTKEGQDLFTPPYQKAGKAIGRAVKGAKGLFDRLVSVRGGGK